MRYVRYMAATVIYLISLFVLWLGTVLSIVSLRYQVEVVASGERIAWYEGLPFYGAFALVSLLFFYLGREVWKVFRPQVWWILLLYSTLLFGYFYWGAVLR